MGDIYVCVIFLFDVFYWSPFFDVHFSYCEVFMCQVLGGLVWSMKSVIFEGIHKISSMNARNENLVGKSKGILVVYVYFNNFKLCSKWRPWIATLPKPVYARAEPSSSSHLLLNLLHTLLLLILIQQLFWAVSCITISMDHTVYRCQEVTFSFIVWIYINVFILFYNFIYITVFILF